VARALPVARTTSRPMSSAHGPPDPWPYTEAYSKRYYGYGLAIIGLSALVHVSINNPFTRNSKPVPTKEVAVVHGQQQAH